MSNTHYTEATMDTNDIARININISDGCLDDVDLGAERGTSAWEAKASETMNLYVTALRTIWRGWYPHAKLDISWSCRRTSDTVEFEDGAGEAVSIGYGAGCELEGLVSEATDRAWCAIW